MTAEMGQRLLEAVLDSWDRNSAWDLIDKSGRTAEEDRLVVALNQASWVQTMASRRISISDLRCS